VRTQLHHLVAEKAAVCGTAPALTVKDTTLTYADLWRQIRAFGTGLRRLPIEPGAHVAVILYPSGRSHPAPVEVPV
jgi:acyl-CoA synthetase (AMP-forming)/AMP-acid ligase II